MTGEQGRPLGETIAEHYRVTGLLGRGSFGTTYAAEDTRTGDSVAIKELSLGRVDDWKVVELFEREARILANLDHPQIPNYIDFLPIQADTPGYLVQQLAPGRSLEARIEAGERFSEAQVRQLAEQLLDILQYLSGLSPPVIHRDIKPGNIIVGDDGRCYLVDFGSVRDAVEASRTGGSTVAGTFGYMAPEQLHGDASVRSDLFGVGMTLIHLLTGILPAELPRKRLKVDFRSHVQIGEQLASVIDRMIEPMPEDRFDGAAAALDGLRGLGVATGPGAVGGGGGALTGDAIAQMVQRKEERAAAEAERAQALALRRAESVARTAKRRVTVHEDEEGLTLAIAPEPLLRYFLQQLPIFGFILVNPGFVVVGGFPFLGRFWPFFADNFVGRAAVWFLFLMVFNAMIARLRQRSLSVRIAGDHYVAWVTGSKKQLGLGPVSNLRVSVGNPNARGYGQASIRFGNQSRTIKRLSTRDLESLRWIDKQVKAAGSG